LRQWDVPGKIGKTYQEGQTINVDIMFAQNHLGRMNVRVCPLDAKDESKCTTLERCGPGL
jgi:NADPH-dependent glutamate synthase beta subunit-like oxidoreductase